MFQLEQEKERKRGTWDGFGYITFPKIDENWRLPFSSPFGPPYKVYHQITDTVCNKPLLEPKIRILLHLVALSVASAAPKNSMLPALKHPSLQRTIEAGIVEGLTTDQIENALQHAKYDLSILTRSAMLMSLVFTAGT